jgi:hypothetical protein
LEFFKHGNQKFEVRFLRFLNNVRDGEEPPEIWLKAIIIPVHRKENIKHW